MKYIHCLLLVVVILSACGTTESEADSTETRHSFHPIVLKAKETSLYAANVDWHEVNETFVELTQENSGDLVPGLQYLINSMGDEHATIRSAKDFSIVASYTKKRREEDNRDSEIINTVINDVSARFAYQLLEDGVGYLKVVGIGAGDVKAQAGTIRLGLIELKKKNVNKWIVDLRVNGGGNMEPMLAGLAPLLGNGYVGGAVNAEDETTRRYHIKDGQFFNSDRLVCEMENVPKIDPNEKVAVLLSRYTASSGELVAVAFRGRGNTRFIGEATAGYTTGNGFEQITDDLYMLISQDIYVDRNRVKYERRVGVDEHLEFQPHATMDNDDQVTRAMQWLRE